MISLAVVAQVPLCFLRTTPLKKNLNFWGRPGVQFRQVTKRRAFQSDFKLSEQETLVKRAIVSKRRAF